MPRVTKDEKVSTTSNTKKIDSKSKKVASSTTKKPATKSKADTSKKATKVKATTSKKTDTAKETTSKVEKKEVVADKKVDNDLSKKTVAELRDMAKEANIEGYATMKKAELLEALK